MKVKVLKHKTIEKVIDLEYPVYLYYQDDDLKEAYIKVNENSSINVIIGPFRDEISISKPFYFHEHLLNCISSKEIFDSVFNEILNSITTK